ncbi:MAG: amidohydrolase [Clostridia bacterium]|nr:amidohydrolase [Clostridia bacterium]
MKLKKLFAFALIPILSLCSLIFVGCNKQVYADLVVYANFYTGDLDSRAEAVAVKDGKFIFVGTKADAQKYITDTTIVKDESTSFGISGFSDAHTHAYVAGESEAMHTLELSELQTSEELFNAVEEYVLSNPTKEYYLGYGWNYNLFTNGTPTKAEFERLNGISSKPIFLKSHDCHSCFVNQAMLDLCEVTKEAQAPEGGIIEKDADGNLLGTFRDTAMDELIKSNPNFPRYTVEEYKSIILEAQKIYAKMGYTAYVDIFIEDEISNDNLCSAYEQLDKAGLLSLKVQAAWTVENKSEEHIKQVIKHIADRKKECAGGMFELTDVKFFMDGVGEVGTAYMLEAYNPAYKENWYGAGRWASNESKRKLTHAIEQVNRYGLVAHLHAIGDAAMRDGLDAIEEAQKNYKSDVVKNVITHCEFIAENDISRFAELDVVANVDLEWGIKFPGAYEVEVFNLGEERAISAYPYRSLLNAGALLSFATDNPCGGTGSPVYGFYIGTHRGLGVDSSRDRNRSEMLTIQQAIDCMTIGGAKQMRQDDVRGQIKVGMDADFVLLSLDLINETDPLCFLNSEASLTVVNGKIIYPQA